MAERSGLVGQTRHIDVKYHHVREHVEVECVRVKVVVSLENLADIFMKNVEERNIGET